MYINKIQIVLASYFQPENHGPGRKIGISPAKPKDIECDSLFVELSPGQLYWDYIKNRKDPEAGPAFESSYKKKLDEFKQEVLAQAKEEDKSVFEILPFSDGDTLLTWENKGNTSYRKLVAQCLVDLGYEVIEN